MVEPFEKTCFQILALFQDSDLVDATKEDLEFEHPEKKEENDKDVEALTEEI